MSSRKLPGDFIIDAYLEAAREAGMKYGEWKAKTPPEERERVRDRYAENFHKRKKKKAGR